MRSAAGLLSTMRSWASSDQHAVGHVLEDGRYFGAVLFELAQGVPQAGMGDVQAVQQRRDFGWRLADQVVQALLADLALLRSSAPDGAPDAGQAVACDFDGEPASSDADAAPTTVGHGHIASASRDGHERQAGQQHDQRRAADQQDRTQANGASLPDGNESRPVEAVGTLRMT